MGFLANKITLRYVSKFTGSYMEYLHRKTQSTGGNRRKRPHIFNYFKDFIGAFIMNHSTKELLTVAIGALAITLPMLIAIV
jgi:hypothetical protein